MTRSLRATRKVVDDRNLCARLGETGHAYARTLTWPGAIQKLLL